MLAAGPKTILVLVVVLQIQGLWGNPNPKANPTEHHDWGSPNEEVEIPVETAAGSAKPAESKNKAQGTKSGLDSSNSLDTSAGENEVRIHEEDLKDDLAKWEAPRFMQERFPYYLSGYDEEEGRPIWVMEIGRTHIRAMVESGGETLRNFEKYTEQIAYRILKSIHAANTTEQPVSEAIFLLDFDGILLRDVTSLPVMSFALRLILKNRDLILNFLGPTIFVNANFVAENAIRLVRPALGPAFQKVEVFGTNSDRWIPYLRHLCGPSQIPTWYGGDKKNFKPVAVYG